MAGLIQILFLFFLLHLQRTHKKKDNNKSLFLWLPTGRYCFKPQPEQQPDFYCITPPLNFFSLFQLKNITILTLFTTLKKNSIFSYSFLFFCLFLLLIVGQRFRVSVREPWTSCHRQKGIRKRETLTPPILMLFCWHSFDCISMKQKNEKGNVALQYSEKGRFFGWLFHKDLRTKGVAGNFCVADEWGDGRCQSLRRISPLSIKYKCRQVTNHQSQIWSQISVTTCFYFLLFTMWPTIVA